MRFTWFVTAFCVLATLTGCQTATKKSAPAAALKSAPLTAKNAPASRNLHSAVWIGDGMLIWGGVATQDGNTDGGVYYPGTKRWYKIGGAKQESRFNHSTIWTGASMIVWGGKDSNSYELLSSGLIYDKKEEDWFVVADEGAPSPRAGHAAVWTGTKMIIWGGESADGYLADGGIYDPLADKWTPIPATDVLSARGYHSYVWTGTKLIVWGGLDADGSTSDGAIFEPVSGKWTTLPDQEILAGRVSHTAVWTGGQMIVWGGRDVDGECFDDGAAYDAKSGMWMALPRVSKGFAPRELHSATWTGKEMIVYGGKNDDGMLADAAVFQPKKQQWKRIKAAPNAVPRAMHSAVWTGDALLIFGGDGAKNQQSEMMEEAEDVVAEVDQEAADEEVAAAAEPEQEAPKKNTAGLQLRFSKRK